MSGEIKIVLGLKKGIYEDAIVKHINACSDIELLGIGCDCREILKIVTDNKPDIVVLDLALPGKDGAWGMNERYKARTEGIKCIGFSAIEDCMLVGYIMEKGIGYFIAEPVEPKTLAERIRQIYNLRWSKRVENDMDYTGSVLDKSEKEYVKRIAGVVNRLGIPASIRGYKYIISSVEMVMKDEEALTGITKNIYPSVAKEYKTSPCKVERAIRHAIESSWNRGGSGRFFDVLGWRNNRRPTNGQLIASMAECINMKQEWN